MVYAPLPKGAAKGVGYRQSELDWAQCCGPIWDRRCSGTWGV
jgi:hypothetical protein